MLSKQDKAWTIEASTKVMLKIVNEVIIPGMDNLYAKIKEDMREITQEITGEMEARLNSKIDKLDRKLSVAISHQANKLDDHETGIDKLEHTYRVRA